MSDARQDKAVDAAVAAMTEQECRLLGNPCAPEDLARLLRIVWKLGYDAGADDQANGRNPRAAGMDPATAAYYEEHARRQVEDSPLVRLLRDAGALDAARRESSIWFPRVEPSAQTESAPTDGPELTLEKYLQVRRSIVGDVPTRSAPNW